MTAIFGRKRDNLKPSATGLQLQTSTNAIPVPIIWGQGRLAPNIIWYDNFKARKVKVGGGKGASSQKTYKYSVSVLLGICEGPIDDVNNVWRDLYFQESGSSFQSSNGAVEYLGTYSQDPWSYLTSNFPDAALAYRGLAYLGLPNYDLGEDPSMPQHSFEINGVLYQTAVGGTTNDADPAELIEDFLTNPYYGTPFRASALDTDSLFSGPNATTTGDAAYQTYCQAMGFGLSPELSETEAAGSILERWLRLTNSVPVWSGNTLKFIPYGDETISANGVVYVPDLTVQYDLTEDDFIFGENEDPVQYTRGDPQDAKNAFYVEVSDRDDDYSLKPVGARDQSSVEQYGKLQAETVTAHEIKDLGMADTVAHLLLQRSAYVRNTFKFYLPQNFIRLEAMDIVTLTTEGLGLDQYRVRITEATELDDGNIEIIAEDFPENIGSTSSYSTQTSTNTPINSNQAPGDIEPPIIFEPPAELTAGSPEVWVAATGAGQYWGGCEIWLSTDDTTYYQIGEIDNTQRVGVLTAELATYGGSNPDTTNTLSVDLSTSQGELESGDTSDVAAGANLCYVDGELITFTDATLTDTYEYDLDDLYRGFYGSTIGVHASGSKFAVLDASIFEYALPDDYIGTTLYVKFLSFNIWGVSLQQLADVTAYEYTPAGTAFDISPASNVTAVGGIGSNTVLWDPSASVNLSGYKVYAVEDATGDFVDSSLVGTVGNGTLSFTHTGLGSEETWRYWVVAYNTEDDATEAGPANATTDELSFGITVEEDDSEVATGVSTLNFEGATVTDEGSGKVTVTITGGGGGGGGSEVHFDVAPGGDYDGNDTGSYATLTNAVILLRDTDVDGMFAAFNAANIGNEYSAFIAEVNSAGAIQNTVATASSTFTTTATGPQTAKFDFDSAATLTAGTLYVFAVVVVGGGTTTPCRALTAADASEGYASLGIDAGAMEDEWGTSSKRFWYAQNSDSPVSGSASGNSTSDTQYFIGVRTVQSVSGGGGGSGAGYFGPLSPPTLTTFPTNVAEGGATGSASNSSTRGLLLTVDGVGNDDWYGQFKAAAVPVSGTDTYICRQIYTCGPSGFPGGGFCLRNSTNTRKLVFGFDGDYSAPPNITVSRWNGAAFGSTQFSGFPYTYDFWFRVDITSAGLCTFYGSRDGALWYEAYSENVSAYLEASGGGTFDQIGFSAKYHTQNTYLSIPFFSDDGSNS